MTDQYDGPRTYECLEEELASRLETKFAEETNRPWGSNICPLSW